MSELKYFQELKYLLDTIARAADIYGLTENKFLQNADLNQSSVTHARRRLKAGSHVLGFNIEFFFKLQSAYPDLNIGGFFDRSEPIQKNKYRSLQHTSSIAAEPEASYEGSSLQACRTENQLLRDKVQLLEELLKMYRKEG